MFLSLNNVFLVGDGSSDIEVVSHRLLSAMEGW